MSSRTYHNQAYNEASASYFEPVDPNYQYEHLRGKSRSQPAAHHHHRSARSQRQEPAPVPVNSAPKQQNCPPWWGWVIIVIGILLLAAVTVVAIIMSQNKDTRRQEVVCPSTPNTKTQVLPRPTSTTPKDVTDCSDVDTSGIYTIVISRLNIKVYCQVDDQGKFMQDALFSDTKVIQRRQDGSENFARNWVDYSKGFGDLDGEHWLGNDIIHDLTAAGYTRLRIDLEDWQNMKYTVYYDRFLVARARDRYKLTVSGFYGTNPPGDSFKNHTGMKFSTYDMENDLHQFLNCALAYRGGWWYRDCHVAHLNGEYNNTEFGIGINWYTWKGFHYSLKKTMMMLTRP